MTFRESRGVDERDERIPDLEPGVLDGAGEPVIGPGSAEGQEVAARFQDADGFPGPGEVPAIDRVRLPVIGHSVGEVLVLDLALGGLARPVSLVGCPALIPDPGPAEGVAPVAVLLASLGRDVLYDAGVLPRGVPLLAHEFQPVRRIAHHRIDRLGWHRGHHHSAVSKLDGPSP